MGKHKCNTCDHCKEKDDFYECKPYKIEIFNPDETGGCDEHTRKRFKLGGHDGDTDEETSSEGED